MARKLLWVLVALAVGLVPSIAVGQEESVFEGEEREDTVHEAGIPIGAFIFSPTLELIYEDKDNIFLSEGPCSKVGGQPIGGECDDVVYVARGRLAFELPFAENYFRVAYMPQWRDYEDYEGLEENWSHFLDFSAGIDTPSGFALDLSNHLTRGVLEVPEVDPGRELVYGNEPFVSDRANVVLGYSITETDFIGVDLSYDTVEYDDPTDLWFDYETLRGGFAYHRDMNPLLRLELTVGASRTDVDRTAEFRNSDGWWARAGLNGELTANLTADVGFGYRNRDFDDQPGVPSQDFSGITVDGGLRYAIGAGTTLELDLLREAFLSNFGNNAYFTASKVGVALESRLVGGLFGSLGGFVQKNDYDVANAAGTYREDDINRAYVGVGYHFNDLLSLRGNYRWEERDSNITGLSYEANTILVNLLVGY